MIALADGRAEEYLRLHREVWPEVLAALSRANITNYSIYRHDGVLFSYLEHRGDDYEADMASLAEDPATQRWWEVMTPMQRTLRATPDDPWWTELEEVFHLD
ncbi:MAG TPA: L-rhamnose mutarotase [Acidimicrobiales bacterium]|nr:L-rhamnose mutarotase [Acidimicrobiales bacterium]